MPARRKVLSWGAATAAAAAAPALAGCGESAGAARLTRQAPRRDGQRVELVFWTWVRLQKAVALWNRKHPGIHVTVQIVPANTQGGYQKMHSALKAGSPPDLAQVEYYALPEFMLVNGLTDLSEHGADKLKSAYVGWQWDQGVFGGRVHAMPQGSGPMAYYYRKDLFERWDIEVPRTWDEFRTAARTVKKRGGGARICAFPPNNAMWYAAFPWQRGARWIRSEGDTWLVDIDSPASLEVADFWDGLLRDGLLSVMPDTQSAWYKAVQSGRLVSWPAAQWGDALLRGNAPGTKGNWRVAPLPQWEKGQRDSANWGGSSTAVLQGTRHPAEAVEFAHWLNTDPESIDLLIQAGYGWPAARVDLDETALGKPDPFFGGQRYNEVFQDADRHVDTSWKWAPTTIQSFEHIKDAFGRATAGQGSLTGALRDVQGRVVDDLQAKGLKVRSA
ncbi:multiple sugar transport system substrate-binding protein [Streptomyces sp. Amel2xB2]|uniref:ABC transporter substrate-binding protein n=1 Tax=Streptomyces sp. Amel2xB2 TaxID=1305829 RepID=UPI000DBA42D6|nr:sugar ABC transporter substrate-binding protein [Streptomyces sp. Amel2xB2]RAJ69070.1 multiple sugar transport system substrate-binding protein [Streptomyces sp. Amel2xB2]